MTNRRSAECILVAALCVMTTVGAQAASKAGVAAAVQKDVQRVTGSNAQALSTGSEVFTNERIRTGEGSNAQILLMDKTTLTIGPRAEMSLDRFVYDPSKKTGGQVVLNAVQGAFRFVSGSQDSKNYSINTPVGTLGVRGTIFDLDVDGNIVNVTLIQGGLSLFTNGQNYILDRPGSSLTVTGTRSSSQIVGGTRDANPAGQTGNAPPSTTMGSIDNQNVIIQQTVRPPTRPCGPNCR